MTKRLNCFISDHCVFFMLNFSLSNQFKEVIMKQLLAAVLLCSVFGLMGCAPHHVGEAGGLSIGTGIIGGAIGGHSGGTTIGRPSGFLIGGTTMQPLPPPPRYVPFHY